ncbi:MAG TPA: PTS system mannose/fructose/sorbose family transporter subunit IID [Gemmatimonadales bacterium]|nr:PTS system mannose/fructose/sorbose family transporter subunit IID [Gemmatimonadales bacterium]
MRGGTARALWRLCAVQGAWNYERMTGVGMGHAAEPLLEDLKSADPARHAEAAVRAADYFNSHPYLAGLALGALVRAEYDLVPGAQITRLRAALTSPLGALGDQFFWAGAVPATMGLAILGVVSGHGLWPIVLLLVLYNAGRIATGVWALRTGLANGMKVGVALGESWLPRSTTLAGLVAGAVVGLAVPLAADWLLDPLDLRAVWVTVATLLVGLAASWKLGPRITAVKFGLVAIGVALLLAWGLP